MNIEAYKSSGKLEQYLLGLLSETEAREVEQVAAAYPEIRAELGAMEDALTQYALARGISMPAELPERIIRRWETLEKEIPATKTVVPKSGGGGAGIVPLLWLLLAGAVAGLLFFFFKKGQVQDDLQQTQTELQILQANCDQVQGDLDQVLVQLAILRSEGNQTFIMRGTENNPGAIANVYYNTTNQTAYLDIRDLPVPPSGQQYQLWGINSKSTAGPQSMDVFDLPAGDSPAFIEVPYLANMDVFAVSLEPTGGSPSPTAVHLISPIPTS